MRRLSLACLVVIIAFAARNADAQDLLLDTEYSFLVASSPSYSATSSTTLTTPAGSQPSLAVYTLTGQVSDACVLSAGQIVQLSNGTSGSMYASVKVNNDYSMTLTAAAGMFASSMEGPDHYSNYQLNGVDPGGLLTFKVVDGGGNPQCSPVVSQYSGQSGIFLRISITNARSGQSLHRPNEGPPIPINGGSLHFAAPIGAKFSCDSGPDTPSMTAELRGASSAIRFFRANIPNAPVPYAPLAGISDWRVTAFPQLVDITPGWRGTYKFSAPSKVLKCTTDGGLLNFIGPDDKPQQFVIDWSPGWFQTRRYVTVPCGTCQLGLTTKGKN